MTAGRPPAPGSAYEQLAAFFDANPDEELTYEDAMAKFGVTYTNARQAVFRLRAAGKVEYAHVIRRPSKGRASNATGWLPGPGPNGGPGGCDVEVTSFEVTGP